MKSVLNTIGRGLAKAGKFIAGAITGQGTSPVEQAVHRFAREVVSIWLGRTAAA